jgi:hypothetical protein
MQELLKDLVRFKTKKELSSKHLEIIQCLLVLWLHLQINQWTSMTFEAALPVQYLENKTTQVSLNVI